MNSPELSIIIPTYNRKALLLKVFETLRSLKQTSGEIEVIVVDDGSTDDTAESVRALTMPFPVTVIRHEQSRGPAIARNRGAAAAQSSILGFLDSDVLVHPDWWIAAKNHFHNPNIAGVEGLTRPPADSPRPTPFTHVVANAKGGNYLTCNMFYRKAVFMDAGGFDERFLRANREDSDLAFTVLEKGHTIVFEPQCIVEHPLFGSSSWVYFREARFGIHEALLRRKHPRLYRQCLKWIDGRAFPVFYWGLYLGVPGMIAGALLALPWLFLASGAGMGLGWSGAVYAVCRKRHVRAADLARLIPQYGIIPWLRLFWILAGEWKYRRIQPLGKC